MPSRSGQRLARCPVQQQGWPRPRPHKLAKGGKKESGSKFGAEGTCLPGGDGRWIPTILLFYPYGYKFEFFSPNAKYLKPLETNDLTINDCAILSI